MRIISRLLRSVLGRGRRTRTARPVGVGARRPTTGTRGGGIGSMIRRFLR